MLNLDVPVGYRLAGGLEETTQKHHHCHAATLDAAPAVRTRRRDPAAHAPDAPPPSLLLPLPMSLLYT